MDDQKKTTALVSKMVELSENDFTKSVLEPLFLAMGYRTDYHGGHNEGGKDLICWRDDDFGEKELTVIQVKKVSASASASSSSSFGEIVTQLCQALEKDVPDLIGTKRKPDKVLFITPYAINTRALESRFEGYSQLRNRGARVYDGFQIAKQLIDRRLSIVSELLGKEHVFRESTNAGFSNVDLLSALSYGKERSVRHFFTDLDFGIGKVRTGTFLDLDFNPITTKLELDEPQWNSLKSVLKSIEEYFGEAVTIPSLIQVEENFKKNHSNWLNEKNKQAIKETAKSIEDIKELIDGLQYILDQISPEISSRRKLRLKGSLNEIESTNANQSDEIDLEPRLVSAAADSVRVIVKLSDEIGDSISGDNWKNLDANKAKNLVKVASDIKEHWPAIKEFINATMIQSLNSVAKSVDSNIYNIQAKTNELAKLLSSLSLEPKYQVEINGKELAKQLRIEQQKLGGEIEALQAPNQHDQNKTKVFFENCLHTLKIADEIFSDARLLQPLGIRGLIDQTSGGVKTSRIHIQIDKLFDTGMNVILYGEAGAGKTTTLDMYAMKIAESDHQEWLPLYLPLTKITGRSECKQPTNSSEALTLFEDEIVRYFNKNNLVTTKMDFRNMLSQKSRVIFLLDGVDEVIKSSPWIVEAITMLQRTYTNSQLIISSRVSGNQMDHLEFLKLTLLPFNDEQLIKFVSAWFADDYSKVETIKNHLADNPHISTIVKTPLLATILCVLADNNVPLPTSELSLYKERLKLLLGHYDIHKGIKRQKSHHDLLEIVARKIAYGFQSGTKRMATIEEIKAIAFKSLSEKYGRAEISLAVDELCDPCNILIPMSIQDEWGFGHLRYQEHLSAEELVRNRGIEIQPLLNSSWWRSVLVLFAQMTDDFESIFSSHILSTGHVGDASDTLKAMISVRPKKERSDLMMLLKQHEKMDALDPNQWDDDFQN